MRNIWLVARHEFRRTVIRRGFILGTLAVPIGLIVLIGLVIFLERSRTSRDPVGYVDLAGVLDPAVEVEDGNSLGKVELQPFADRGTAEAALEQGQIQALYVLPEGYPADREVALYYLEEPPGEQARSQFEALVRANLVRSLDPAAADRLLAGPTVVVEDLASGRTFDEEEGLGPMVAIFVVLFFIIAISSAAGYMLMVVADEKENRTIEVVITSVTARQLIAGKGLGLLAAALTQLLVYFVAAALALGIASRYFDFMRAIVIPWGYIALLLLYFVPTFALAAGLMIALGASVTDLQHGQQVAGLLNLLFIVPVFLLPAFFSDANSPLVTALTLFPTTSLMTIAFRWSFTSIPIWQLAASWLLLAASAVFMMWAAGRIFRAGMLRFGQPLTVQAILTALRGAS